MIIRGFIINTSKMEIEKDDINYDDKRVEGMFVKVLNYYGNKSEIVPAAYVFPMISRDAVVRQLEILKQAKKNYDDLVADVYYKVFPTLR